MTQDEFAALQQEVNRKAIEYVHCEKSVQLREEIWLSLWEMRPYLFRAKAIRGYINFSLSGLYDPMEEEFLTDVFLEAVPQALMAYAKGNSNVSSPPPFMNYFRVAFSKKVSDAYGNVLDKMPHDYIEVRKPLVQVYQQPEEGTLISGIHLAQKAVRRILGRVPDEDPVWFKVKFKDHGRTVYVRKADVEYHNKAILVNEDDAIEPGLSDSPENEVLLSNIYDEYILNLLSLAQQVYSRAQVKSSTGLNRKYCFKLLYTETLLNKIKQIYDAIGDVQTIHEQDALSAAEIEMLDYLLTDLCRTFTSIASTPLHAKRDYKYLNSDSTEEISIPIANIIYAHFLVDIKRIDRKLDAIAPSLSKHRAEFKKLYDSICDIDTIYR